MTKQEAMERLREITKEVYEIGLKHGIFVLMIADDMNDEDGTATYAISGTAGEVATVVDFIFSNHPESARAFFERLTESAVEIHMPVFSSGNETTN